MNDDIRKVARLLDADLETGLSHEKLRSRLAEVVDRSSASSILVPLLKLNTALQEFAQGKITTRILRERAEDYLNVADHAFDLACASLDQRKDEYPSYEEDEIALLTSEAHHGATYEFLESASAFLADKPCEKFLDHAYNMGALANNIYRNVTILEANKGGGFCSAQIEEEISLQDAVDKFDRVLAEAVTMGAIAMRPAVLGTQGQRSPGEVFPSKQKKRWYLKYVTDR